MGFHDNERMTFTRATNKACKGCVYSDSGEHPWGSSADKANCGWYVHDEQLGSLGKPASVAFDGKPCPHAIYDGKRHAETFMETPQFKAIVAKHGGELQ